MKFGAVENKARLALTLFVVALLLTIGLSLALYSQARRELANERTRHVKLEAALLASSLSSDPTTLSDAELKEYLQRLGISAVGAVYGPDSRRMALASTIDRTPEPRLLAPRLYSPSRTGVSAQGSSRSLVASLTRSESGYEIAESPAMGSSVVVLARPAEGEASPVIFYVFSYQIIALVFGLGLILLLVRWLLRPYRRMVEAARGSPVHPSPGVSESEFVVQTFQALIGQLQAKERELAQLHALERERAERSERFSERLVANIPSGLVTVDSTGLVTSANTYAREIFGPVDSAGQPSSGNAIVGGFHTLAIDLQAFFRAAPRLVDLIGKCLSQGIAFRREEVEVTDPDGRTRHLGLSISPITDAAHRVEGALCLMTDITEVIELRERMKLQENLANLGEMAAGLAHEFKNSLATIHGYVQLLDATGSVTPERERSRTLDSMLNEVRLLARLVTDFLNFARPQQINPTEVNLRSLIEDCAEEIAQQLKQAGIALRLDGRFATLAGDESLLRRAFVNLLRNAVEAIDLHSPEKLIEVTSWIDGGRGPRYAHVRVRDTGGGISEDNLNRIFIPFFTTKSRGYGIGLALVQKILVAHGGSVSVEKSDCAGTVFHCRLPLAPIPLTVERESHVVK